MIPISDVNPTSRFPFITIALIVSNILIFVLQLFDFEGMIKKYSLIPVLFPEESYRIITYMFLHGNLLHIAGNMLYLWIFGNNVEDVFGPLRFSVFYLICGVFGALLHLMFYSNSPVPMVGASGAISGILGAYLVFFPFARVKTLVFFFIFVQIIEVPAFFFITFWFIWQILGLGLPSNVAYLAHIGGFITGFVIARIMKRKLLVEYFRRRRMRW